MMPRTDSSALSLRFPERSVIPITAVVQVSRIMRNMNSKFFKAFGVAILFLYAFSASATDFDVGPGLSYSSIGAVPWESVSVGDRVLIHWREDPYREKWVICGQGSEAEPIVVRGVPGPSGQLPVIDGENATTRMALNYWNESRGVLKIGGASVPADTLPSHIVIENLDIRSGRPPYSFTDTGGNIVSYAENAASIYVEKAVDLRIRNCVLHDSGNGLFIGAYDGQTQDILIEGNWIYDNGIEGSYYEHNTYTAAIDIVYQFNRFGLLRGTAGGNNLKDRSAGLVVRWNWIEGGNRQLDLVDAEDSSVLVNHPHYHETFVYGNILIEAEGQGNSQIVHYGGDSVTTDDYRKGMLYFYNNTVVSTRDGNTTLMRLSTNEESADVRNNIIYTSASSDHLAMLGASGVMDLGNNWLSQGWVTSHDSFTGTVNDAGTNLEGSDPLFLDHYMLAPASVCVDAGGSLSPLVLPEHALLRQYLPHRRSSGRPSDGLPDLGAYEMGVIFADDFSSGGAGFWSWPEY